MSLKNRLRDWQHSESAVRRYSHFATKALWRTYQFATIPEQRWQRITSWVYRDQYYQRSAFTACDRYPELFTVCRQHLEKVACPNILSFGCSTGEEVTSLAKYLPQATIVGVDINRWCVRHSRLNCKGERFLFCLRTSDEFRRAEDFDAILCLAVFQRTENRNSPGASESVGIRFDQFEREIEILDRKLKPGGLFIIDQSDFSFLDAKCSVNYEPLEFEGNRATRTRPLFDRNNRRISEEQRINRVFVKRRN